MINTDKKLLNENRNTYQRLNRDNGSERLRRKAFLYYKMLNDKFFDIFLLEKVRNLEES